MALGTENVPGRPGILFTTFGKLVSCSEAPVYVPSVEAGHGDVSEVVVVLGVLPAAPASSLSVRVAGGAGGDHQDLLDCQQP